MRRLCLLAVLLAIALAVTAAQARIVAETAPAAKGDAPGAAQPATLDTPPEPIRDLSRLPEKARQTRERILEAARTGDLDKLVAVMKSYDALPVFSFGGETDPVELWKESYPDSDGLEILGILVDLLEAPFVHLDEGTPQEMYVWPYFYALPLADLTPEQKVELFRLVTGSDWKEMLDFGAYIFYRVGISPDGKWHFFVAGD